MPALGSSVPVYPRKALIGLKLLAPILSRLSRNLWAAVLLINNFNNYDPHWLPKAEAIHGLQ